MLTGTVTPPRGGPAYRPRDQKTRVQETENTENRKGENRNHWQSQHSETGIYPLNICAYM